MGVCHSTKPAENRCTSPTSSEHNYLNNKRQLSLQQNISNKDVDEWSVNDVNRWVLSVERIKLNDVAAEFKKKKIDGLRLMGINEKYLTKLGISEENITQIISARDLLLSLHAEQDTDFNDDNNPNVSPKSPSKSISPASTAAASPSTRTQPKQPRAKASNKNVDQSIPIPTTAMQRDSSMDTDNEYHDENEPFMKTSTNVLPMINELTPEPPDGLVPVRTNKLDKENGKDEDDVDAEHKNEAERPLDQQLLFDLVHFGLSGMTLTDNFAKSMSYCQSICKQKGIKSPRKERGHGGSDDDGDDEKKNIYKPPFNKELTPANVLTLGRNNQSNGSNLNVNAPPYTPGLPPYIPGLPRAHSAPNSVSHKTKRTLPKIDETLPFAISPVCNSNHMHPIHPYYCNQVMNTAYNLIQNNINRLNHHNDSYKDEQIKSEESKSDDIKKKRSSSKNKKENRDFMARHRAQNNFTISKALTDPKGIIDQRIKERIPNLFKYMDLSTIIQYNHEYNDIGDVDDNQHGTVRVLDYDFHDKITDEKLYCIVRKTKDDKNKWKMDEKLYTAKDIDSLSEIHDLPKSTRESKEFVAALNQKQEIEKMIRLKDKMKSDIVQKTKWSKTWIKTTDDKRKIKNANKIRRILAISNQEFQKRIENLNFESEEVKNAEAENDKERKVDLIPIVVFDDHGYDIEHVEIMNITDNVDIAISYQIINNHDNNNKNTKIEVKSIYVDKDVLIKCHHLVSPQHIANCTCFESFKTNIDMLEIGNPDDRANQIKDLQQKVKTLKSEVKELKSKPAASKSPSMSSGPNTPGSKSSNSSIYNYNMNRNGGNNQTNKPSISYPNINCGQE